LIFGVIFHGCSCALIFVTAQIYLDQRVEPAWRARAQALMAVMNGEVGSLAGYLGAWAWFSALTHEGETQRPVFWSGLWLAAGAVLIFSYRCIAAAARVR